MRQRNCGRGHSFHSSVVCDNLMKMVNMTKLVGLADVLSRIITMGLQIFEDVAQTSTLNRAEKSYRPPD